MEPEFVIRTETKTVKGGKTIKLNVRNVFYKGFWGKLRTIYTWLRYNHDKSFQEYLDSPVTYKRELAEYIDFQHGIDAEAELTKILSEEVENEILKKHP